MTLRDGVWVHFPATDDDGVPRLVAAPCHSCVWVERPSVASPRPLGDYEARAIAEGMGQT